MFGEWLSAAGWLAWARHDLQRAVSGTELPVATAWRPTLSAARRSKPTAVEAALDAGLADYDVRVQIFYRGAGGSIMKTRPHAATRGFKPVVLRGSNARSRILVLAGRNKLPVTSLISDQRGAVAFETLILWLFMMLSLLLPLADVAIAGFQFISAWEALRAFGQYVQLHPPPDVTNTSGWTLPTGVAGYTISNVQVLCGDTSNGAVCSSANVALPTKYYSYTTSVTLSPFNYLKPVLCRSINTNPCSFTLSYSERFE